MTRPFRIDTDRQAEILGQAVSKRFPAQVTFRQIDNWCSCKTRFLTMDRHVGELLIEYPQPTEGPPPEIVGGQSMDVSFRRGHKKCVFNTLVLGQCRFTLGTIKNVPALKLQYPDEMVELQRRLYHRATVPANMTVPVHLEREEHNQAGAICQATMLDVSAGGISVVLPKHNRPDWDRDEPVRCSFRTNSTEPPINVIGQVRHAEPMDGERVRVGVHFVGLETDSEQSDTLQRITRLASRFQRRGPGRRL